MFETALAFGKEVALLVGVALAVYVVLRSASELYAAGRMRFVFFPRALERRVDQAT